MKLDRALKIQTGGKSIHLSQIRSQTRSLHQTLQHILLPMSTYHYNENIISNVSLVARLVNEYCTKYNTRDDNAIYVWSKDYGKHIQFPRDYKFNLYYIDISEADMDKHCCPNTLRQALECISIVLSTIMDHYKDIDLDMDLLFVNKIPILLMVSWNIGFTHFKALLSKHNKCVQNRLQQIVQSRGSKTLSPFVRGVLKI